MGFIDLIKNFFKKNVCNSEWTCAVCDLEKFNKGVICEECEKKLPYNNEYICAHCGRKTLASTQVCSTCSEVLTAIDRGRSVFTYEGDIPRLIMGYKYYNNQYLTDFFAEKLSFLYFQNYFNADIITCVPMTKKAKNDRGYNQSELLARALSERVNVPFVECVVKVKDTKRQAKLKRRERLKNLEGAFKVTKKSLVNDKKIVIVDDVSTTGSTAQAIAVRLKNAGAIRVYLLSVASTPPIDKY